MSRADMLARFSALTRWSAQIAAPQALNAVGLSALAEELRTTNEVESAQVARIRDSVVTVTRALAQTRMDREALAPWFTARTVIRAAAEIARTYEWQASGNLDDDSMANALCYAEDEAISIASALGIEAPTCVSAGAVLEHDHG